MSGVVPTGSSSATFLKSENLFRIQLFRRSMGKNSVQLKKNENAFTVVRK